MRPAAAGSRLNAMTVDVEDYFHVSVFDKTVRRTDWGSMESRVVANTERLLDLFDEHDVRGTFFVLGWVAEQHPSLVRSITRRGHELASQAMRTGSSTSRRPRASARTCADRKRSSRICRASGSTATVRPASR